MDLSKKINIIFLLVFFYLYSLCIKKYLSFNELKEHLKGFKRKKILSIECDSLLSTSNKLFRKLRISNCMNSAMTVYFVMKLCNMNPKFCIGVFYNNSEFISHAWLEIEDMIFDTNKQNISALKKIIEI